MSAASSGDKREGHFGLLLVFCMMILPISLRRNLREISFASADYSCRKRRPISPKKDWLIQLGDWPTLSKAPGASFNKPDEKRGSFGQPRALNERREESLPRA
jgi:hypothetical protein